MDKADLDQLINEGRNIEEAAKWSSQIQFEQAKLWRGKNYIAGIPATALGAVAGAATLGTTVGRFWAGIAMLTATSLTAIMTTLNLSRHKDEAVVAANAYLAVQQDARIFYKIRLPKMEYDEGFQALSELVARQQEVNKSAPLVSKRAYRRASKNISSGGQTYETEANGTAKVTRPRFISYIRAYFKLPKK
jgi:hypothetical protein